MKSLSRLLTSLLIATLAPVALGDVQAIDRAIRLSSGQEASFTQKFLPRGYKKEQIESGTVVFGSAPASRWTYERPEEKVFVFDGSTSWMYVPADETVMVHRVSAEEKGRLPFFVLSDPDKLEEWYDVAVNGETTRLQAKVPDALLRTIELRIDSSGRIDTLTYEDAQGNRTSFVLREWRKANTTDDTFTFAPPPGVDVIEN